MADNLAICIARQFGSGGHNIAKKVAQNMGIPFYDKELLKLAAEKSGILEELFEKNDEKPTGSLMYTLSTLNSRSGGFSDYNSYFPNERMQSVIGEVIKDVSEKGPCIILGRCADYILRNNTKMISAFIWANTEKRVERVKDAHHLTGSQAASLVRKTDRNRASYYRFTTERDWGSADNYDISVNVTNLSQENAALLIQKSAELFVSQK